MDHFIMAYVITVVAVLECIAVGWIWGAKKFAAEVNRTAEIKIGPIFSSECHAHCPKGLIGSSRNSFRNYKSPQPPFPKGEQSGSGRL